MYVGFLVFAGTSLLLMAWGGWFWPPAYWAALLIVPLGADLCNSARGMMFALGCVHSLTCNTNRCPSGVATQDPRLYRGLVVADKAQRVAQFHAKTVHATAELIASAGLFHISELNRTHIIPARRSIPDPALRRDLPLRGGWCTLRPGNGAGRVRHASRGEPGPAGIASEVVHPARSDPPRAGRRFHGRDLRAPDREDWRRT
jgi:hypothetical protein